MAYLGRTGEVKEYVVKRARAKHEKSRFPAFWGPNYDWVPDQDHGSILMKALQSRLMQVDGKRNLTSVCKGNDLITIGSIGLRVIQTLGHSKESVFLLGEGSIFTGDTLFSGSIGRTGLLRDLSKK